LDPTYTKNLDALETHVDASTQEFLPIIGAHEPVSTPGSLPHDPASTSATVSTSFAWSPARVATLDLTSALGSSAAGGIHLTIQ
jgi:hypothetical protein